MTTQTITDTTAGFARGVNKTLVAVPEATYGTAPAAGGGVGKVIRRNTAVFNLTTQLIASQEILQSQQTRDARQGPRTVQGTLAANLTCSTYTMFWEGLLRANFAAGITVDPMEDTTGTLNGDDTFTLASTGTNFAGLGILQGDIVQFSGLQGDPSVANGVNLRVLSLPTNNSIIVAPPNPLDALVGWTTGQVMGFGVVGKKLIMPASGQVVPSFTFEEWLADVGIGYVSTGCRVTQASINIPASGFVSCSMSFTGQNQAEESAQTYTAAAAATTTEGLTAVGGLVIYKGKAVRYITNASIQIAAQTQADPVVGSNVVADVLVGDLSVNGSFSCMLLGGDSITDDYLNELEVDLAFTLTDSGAPGANFFSIYLPRVKLSSGTRNDSDRAITRSFNFVALENTTNPNAAATTIVLQDSQA